ncbi:MAG TPA: hypothetical protein VFZ93_00445 [Albitalea sp.]
MDPRASTPLPPDAPAAEPTGHYGPGYGDPQPVEIERSPVEGDARHAAYRRWREARLQEMDEDYAAWCESGEAGFPDDFDAWRRQRRELLLQRSPAGIPMAAAGEDAPRTTKTNLLFERS